MTSARSCGLGSLAAIVVPGKTLVGSVRKASSVCSSHVMPDAVIALEYLAPATVPGDGRKHRIDVAARLCSVRSLRGMSCSD